MGCCGVIQTVPQSVFYSTLLPILDNTIDIGTSVGPLRFNDIFLGGQINVTDSTSVVQGSFVANLANTAVRAGAVSNHSFEILTNNLPVWRFNTSGQLVQNTTNGAGIIMGVSGANLGPILNGASTLDADVTGIVGTHVPFVGVQNPAASSHLALIANNANADGVQAFFFKTRGTGTDANTIVASGDILSETVSLGADGSVYRVASRIRNVVDAAPAAGSIPTRMEFHVNLGGTGASRVWFMNSSGQLLQDTTNGQGIILGRSGSNLGPILNGASTLDADVTGITGTHYGIAIVQSAGSVSDHALFIGNGNDTQGPIIRSFKTRGTGTDANTIVANGDILYELFAYGADGASYLNAARYRIKVDGAPASTDMPGRHEFLTRIAGAGGALAVRWSILNDGILQNNTAANESTGAGAALLGANCPAGTVAAPFTWIKLKSSDGSTVYMPVWK